MRKALDHDLSTDIAQMTTLDCWWLLFASMINHRHRGSWLVLLRGFCSTRSQVMVEYETA